MQSCAGMEFSREEKTGGHIWVPGPPALPRCLPPAGFPTCLALLHISYLLAAAGHSCGARMQIACDNINVGRWGEACGKQFVFHNSVSTEEQRGPGVI